METKQNPYIKYIELRQKVFSNEIHNSTLEELLSLKDKLTSLTTDFNIYVHQVMTQNVKIAMSSDFNKTNEELDRLILKASDIEVVINCVPGYAPHEITTRNMTGNMNPMPNMMNPMPNIPIFSGFNPTFNNVQMGRPVQPNFNNLTNNTSVIKEVNKIKDMNKQTEVTNEATDKDVEDLYNIFYSIIHNDVIDRDLIYTGEKLTLPYIFEHHINPKFVYHLFGSIYNNKQTPDGFTHMFMKKFYTLLVKDLYKNLLEFENVLRQSEHPSLIPDRILEQLKEMDKRI